MTTQELEAILGAAGEDYKQAFNDGIEAARDIIQSFAMSDGWVEERASEIVAKLLKARK